MFCKSCVVSNQRPRISFGKDEYVMHVKMLKIKLILIGLKGKKN